MCQRKSMTYKFRKNYRNRIENMPLTIKAQTISGAYVQKKEEKELNWEWKEKKWNKNEKVSNPFRITTFQPLYQSCLSIHPICVSTRTNLWVLPGNWHALIHSYNPPQISLSIISHVERARRYCFAHRQNWEQWQQPRTTVSFFLDRSDTDIGTITFFLFQSSFLKDKNHRILKENSRKIVVRLKF